MPVSRSFIAGETNYIGASLEDLISHLDDWLSSTLDTIEELDLTKEEFAESKELIDHSDAVVEFVDNVVADFTRIADEFRRVISELRVSVEQRRLDAIKHLLEFSYTLEDYCIDFKREHLLRSLRHEEVRPLLDHIYACSRRQAIDYKDLSNLSYQLKTFVGTTNNSLALTADDIDVLELKPNVFGFGVNLNHLIKLLIKWIRQSN